MTNEDGVVVGGNGVIGKATAKALGLTKVYDLHNPNITLKEAEDYRFIFFCLPTPYENNGYNIKLIEGYFKQLSKNHVFVVRSTVYPGFGDHMAEKYGSMIISYPEFLTEKTAEADAINPDIVVAGSKHKPALDELNYRFLSRLPGQKFLFSDCAHAEFIKLAINGLYSTKVLYANMMYDYAGHVGVSWDKIKDVMYQRKWIGQNHLKVPWQGLRGLHGKCLPKDYKALATYSCNPFLQEWVKYNESIGGE